jgi:putative heme utilization carrier protein HutX
MSPTDIVQRIRDAIAAAPSKMTMQIARDLEVPEAEVIRQLPQGRAVELAVERWEELMGELPAFGKVHVIVTSGAATMESVGAFGNFSTWGEFFNVQTKTLDMHIRWANVGCVFAVEKPSHMSGINTLSFQFFDKTGQPAFKVFLTFGSSKPEPELLARFQRVREKYRKQ